MPSLQSLCRRSEQSKPRKAGRQPQLPPCLPHRQLRLTDGTPAMIHGYRWEKGKWRVRARAQVCSASEAICCVYDVPQLDNEQAAATSREQENILTWLALALAD